MYMHTVYLLYVGNGRSVYKWWEIFCPDTSETALQHIARQIMAIYNDNHITSSVVEDSGSKRGDKTTSEHQSEIVLERTEAEMAGREHQMIM